MSFDKVCKVVAISADSADYPLMFSRADWRASLIPLFSKRAAVVNANVPFDPAPPLFRLSCGALDRDREFWRLGAYLLAGDRKSVV